MAVDYDVMDSSGWVAHQFNAFFPLKFMSMQARKRKVSRGRDQRDTVFILNDPADNDINLPPIKLSFFTRLLSYTDLVQLFSV